jgi:hypothetical protein
MSYGRVIEACLNRDRWNPLKTLDQSADLQSAAIRRRRRRRRWVRRLACAAALVAGLVGLALLAHAHARAPAPAPAHAPARAPAPAHAHAHAPTPPRARARVEARGIHESRPLFHCSEIIPAAVVAGTGEPGR